MKTCTICKNSLDESAFWDDPEGKICKGCWKVDPTVFFNQLSNVLKKFDEIYAGDDKGLRRAKLVALNHVLESINNGSLKFTSKNMKGGENK